MSRAIAEITWNVGGVTGTAAANDADPTWYSDDTNNALEPALTTSVLDERTRHIAASGSGVAGVVTLSPGRYFVELFCSMYADGASTVAAGLAVTNIGLTKLFFDRDPTRFAAGNTPASIFAAEIIDVTADDGGIKLHVARRTGSGTLDVDDAQMFIEYLGDQAGDLDYV